MMISTGFRRRAIEFLFHRSLRRQGRLLASPGSGSSADVMEQGHIDLTVTSGRSSHAGDHDTGANRTVLNLAAGGRESGFLARRGSSARQHFKDDPDTQSYPRRFANALFRGGDRRQPGDPGAAGNLWPAVRATTNPRRSSTGQPGRAYEDDIAHRLAPDMIIGMDVLRHLHHLCRHRRKEALHHRGHAQANRSCSRTGSRVFASRGAIAYGVPALRERAPAPMMAGWRARSNPLLSCPWSSFWGL